jgi:hypothetical protein
VICRHRRISGCAEKTRKRRELPVRIENRSLRAFTLWTMLAFLAAQASALPIRIGFAFLHGNEKPVTEGCERKTCCTALCYVDKHGVHHCVHRTDDSDQCGRSTNELKSNPEQPLPIAVLPKADCLIPVPIQAEWIPPAKVSVEIFDIAIPTPPPK